MPPQEQRSPRRPMGRMDVLAPAMDQSLALNRSKLLRLAESIKTRKRTPAPTTPSRSAVQCDPSLTNIEHLVFGPTYRPKASPPPPPSCDSPSSGVDSAVQRSHTTTTCRVVGRADMKGGNSPGIVTAPNYHSLDRNRTNVTLVHVNYPSPTATTPPVSVDSSAVAASKERRQRTPLTRSQQKPPVQLQSPPKTTGNLVPVSATVAGRKNEPRKVSRIVKSTSASTGVCIAAAGTSANPSAAAALVKSSSTVVGVGANANSNVTVNANATANSVSRSGRRPSHPPPPPKNSLMPTNSCVRRPSSSKECPEDRTTTVISTKRSDAEDGSSCSSLSPGTVTSDSGSSLYLSVYDSSSTGEEPSPPPPPLPKQQQPSRVPTPTSNSHPNVNVIHSNSHPNPSLSHSNSHPNPNLAHANSHPNPKLIHSNSHPNPSLTHSNSHPNPSLSHSNSHPNPNLAHANSHPNPKLTHSNSHPNPSLTHSSSHPNPELVQSNGHHPNPNFTHSNPHQNPSVAHSNPHQNPSVAHSNPHPNQSLAHSNSHPNPSLTHSNSHPNPNLNPHANSTVTTTNCQPRNPRNPPPALRRSLSSNATSLHRTGSRGSLSSSRGSFVPVKSSAAPSIPPPAPPTKSSRDEASECQVTCVKALPPPTSTSSTCSATSVPRSPERVYKALYTWYEPRRRLSFPSSSSSNANNSTHNNISNGFNSSNGHGSNGSHSQSSNTSHSHNNAVTVTAINSNCNLSQASTNTTTSSTDHCPPPAPTIRSSIKRPPSGRTQTLPKSFTSPTASFYVDAPVPAQLQNVVPRIDDSLSDSRPKEKTKPAVEAEREPQFLDSTTLSLEQNKAETTSNKDSGSPIVSRGPSCLSKAVRRVKASSSPPALATSATDLSASDSDLRRPWSQVYSEREAENLLKQGPTAPLSCTDLASVPEPAKSIPALSGRCSSLRAGGGSRPQGTPVESVLLKFRKSFSMRFQKNHLRSASPDPEGSSPGASPCESPLGGSTPNVAPENVFRFGPIVWRSSKERKSKSKIEISAPTMVSAQPSSPPSSATCSPVPVRPKASSLRLERPKRPLSEMGTGFSSSVALSSPGRSSLREERRRDIRHSLSDLGGADIREALKNHEHKRTSPCAFKMPPKKTLSRRAVPRQKCRLRRSVSQPMEMDKLTSLCSLSHIQGLSDQEDTANDSSNSSSDDEAGFHASKGSSHPYLQAKYVTYAEALWDHVTMDPEELPFKAGEQVAVLDCTHRSWWFGSLGVRVGWFPSSFVRPRVNQEDTVEDHVARMNDGISSPSNRKLSVSLLSNDQVRINVIKEIVATERDFVQHLKDVIEGYLKQVRKRPDMFSEDRIATIFGNMEQLHAFQSAFLQKLEACIDWHNPEQSQLGSCFVEHKEGFQVYSEYCNNHPQAVNELQELFVIPKYSHFFEACRLLQEMIDISLDGFLLTPVQKICKYPLQLAELLKYTRDDHPDYPHVAEALEAMREVAHYINERKRRMECLEKLAAWQLSVEYWEGPDLLDDSSELIHSGEVTKMTSSWSRDVTLFLFDHQLVVCKKDLLKRQTFCYKNRISMDGSQVVDLPDGRDTQSGLVVKSAWRVFCGTRAKWYTFCAKTIEEKSQWMKAFHDERRRVSEDQQQGFVVSEKAKSTAMRVVKSQQKRPKGKGVKEFPPRRSARLPTPHHPVLHAKTASLPHGVLLATAKKKNSGWFNFGSSKKHKR